jgi:hypothetical protein
VVERQPDELDEQRLIGTPRAPWPDRRTASVSHKVAIRQGWPCEAAEVAQIAGPCVSSRQLSSRPGEFEPIQSAGKLLIAQLTALVGTPQDTARHVDLRLDRPPHMRLPQDRKDPITT